MVDSIIKSFDVWTDAQGVKSKGRVNGVANISLDGIVRLRELILQLAVSGRLTSEDANGEPANELMKRIEKEKRKFVDEEKIPKEKALPNITDKEKPFELPTSWQWVRLGEVTNYGFTKKVEPGDVEKSTWVLDLEDIQKGSSKLLQKVRVADKEYQSSKNRFSKGDVIYGKLRPYLDKVLVADEDGICTAEMIPIKGYLDIQPEYLRLVLKSSYFIKYATESTHGMNLPRLGTEKARLALFPLTSLSEQTRIVAKVDSLMALCDQLEAAQTANLKTHQLLVTALLQTLTAAPDADEIHAAWLRLAPHFDTLFCTEDSIDQLKQTVLQLAVMGRLVKQDPDDEPAGELVKRIEQEKAELTNGVRLKKEKPLPKITDGEKPFALPKNWEWVRLQQITQISSGDGLTASQMNSSGDVPVFGGNGINGYHDNSNVSKPTLVIGRVGFYCGSIHITPSSAWVTDNAFITSFSEKNIDLDFLSWLLKGTNLKENDSATAQPVISGRKIYPIVVGLPPLSEQKLIVAKLEELLALCDALKTKMENAKGLKVSLSKTVVEGVVG